MTEKWGNGKYAYSRNKHSSAILGNIIILWEAVDELPLPTKTGAQSRRGERMHTDGGVESSGKGLRASECRMREPAE
jgi:hypothetical protein